MWSYQHAIVTDAPKEWIWKLWADMQNWNEWNNRVKQCYPNGDLSNGIGYVLKLRGVPKMIGAIRDCEFLKSFANVGGFSLIGIELRHEIKDVGGRVRLIHQVKVSGKLCFLFGGVIGKRISKGVPAAMENLARLAIRVPNK